MTPEEAADISNRTMDSSSDDVIQRFLLGASARDIQIYIHKLRIFTQTHHFQLAKIALKVRISQDASESARKLERYTVWLIGLTLALVGLTVFLCLDAYFSHHDVSHKSNTVSHDSK